VRDGHASVIIWIGAEPFHQRLERLQHTFTLHVAQRVMKVSFEESDALAGCDLCALRRRLVAKHVRLEERAVRLRNLVRFQFVGVPLQPAQLEVGGR
jgi:hypothetical protein